MTTSALAVFARYPEAGKCKTRLIPQLGSEAAAELHRQMLAHTLKWTRELAESSDSQLEIQILGGDMSSFRRELVTKLGLQASLAESIQIIPQVDGDLGDKLQACVRGMRAAGFQRALIVGTDCPQLNAAVGRQALESLSEHQVCFAPAADGGYVLLAVDLSPRFAREIDRLFKGIAWGTEQVFNQSLAALEKCDVRVRLLPTFQDVDRPEDLAVWERRHRSQAVKPRLSMIIPVYGVEPQLEKVIVQAQTAQEVEILISAAGESHHALNVAGRRQVQFLAGEPGRASQMNRAVKFARGEQLLFLHADTLLPDRYELAIDRILSDPGVVAGAFRLKLDSNRPAAKWIERGVAWRSQHLSLPYGDQGIFMRRSDFESCGGFELLPIMEDYEFIRRLKRKGAIRVSDSAVTTSSRRWQDVGFFKATLINQLMVLGYHLGVSLEQLARFYRGKRRLREQEASATSD